METGERCVIKIESHGDWLSEGGGNNKGKNLLAAGCDVVDFKK